MYNAPVFTFAGSHVLSTRTVSTSNEFTDRDDCHHFEKMPSELVLDVFHQASNMMENKVVTWREHIFNGVGKVKGH